MPLRSPSGLLCVIAVLLCLPAGPAGAVFSGEMSPRPPSSDKDYAAGIAAFEKGHWASVVENIRKVIARRPHHDNAWGRLGYAYRKLGRYDEAIAAYKRSLALNPRHRASLEYLGEAYLDLGRPDEARKVLADLAAVCRRVALVFTDGDFRDGCGEYRELKAAIEAYDKSDRAEKKR